MLTLSSLLYGFPLGPTKCEVERFTATSFGHPYVPSCRRNGDYQAVQCQTEGPCWCVDAQGKEMHGTRQQGEPPSCGGFPLGASSFDLGSYYFGGPPDQPLWTPLIQLPSNTRRPFCPSGPSSSTCLRTSLSSLTSNMFLILCQTSLHFQGAQGILGGS